ncbi:hypothetical protein Patl1_29373 [Pistacia atlantica]|uniref:Uncharacterized protein n=1 Tax=Pistacia atlantica TaxID=434234 RepID=A0ACC1AAX4_9ROSI|nr:hypothetical protein Patl1_29373 [Pistacia atlantica]
MEPSWRLLTPPVSLDVIQRNSDQQSLIPTTWGYLVHNSMMDTQSSSEFIEAPQILPPPPGTFVDREELIQHVGGKLLMSLLLKVSAEEKQIVEHACGLETLQIGEYFFNVSSGIDSYSIREPLGVCCGICYFDFPAMIPSWDLPRSNILYCIDWGENYKLPDLPRSNILYCIDWGENYKLPVKFSVARRGFK